MKFPWKETFEENEKLKLLNLEKSCINTFKYLSLHYKINFLKIKLKTQNKEEVIFDNLNKELKFIETLIFKQNSNTTIIFEFYENNKRNLERLTSHLETIKFSLQLFSQSIFNKYMEKTINEMALIDHNTGTYNRNYLNNYVNSILSISNREQKKIAFVKVAIDQFKAVIDEFNYTIGDKVLKTLALSLGNTIRKSDTIIKISNDEFLVILLNIINENNAIMISEKIINNFNKEKTIVDEKTNQTLMKTICCGVSIYPDDATTVDEIIKKSDIALYEAQNRGRSQVFKFTEEETHTIEFF